MADESIYLKSRGIPGGGETPGAGIFLSPQGDLDIPSFSNWFTMLEPADQSAIAQAIAGGGPSAPANATTTPPATAAAGAQPLTPGGVETQAQAGLTTDANALGGGVPFTPTDNLPGIPGSTTQVGGPTPGAGGIGAPAGAASNATGTTGVNTGSPQQAAQAGGVSAGSAPLTTDAGQAGGATGATWGGLQVYPPGTPPPTGQQAMPTPDGSGVVFLPRTFAAGGVGTSGFGFG